VASEPVSPVHACAAAATSNTTVEQQPPHFPDTIIFNCNPLTPSATRIIILINSSHTLFEIADHLCFRVASASACPVSLRLHLLESPVLASRSSASPVRNLPPTRPRLEPPRSLRICSCEYYTLAIVPIDEQTSTESYEYYRPPAQID
jgi:hypothetical protein